MKTTKIFLLGAVDATFASTTFAAEPLLSPRTAAHQIKIVNSSVATPAITVAYVDSGSAAILPRAQANQIKVVNGANRDANPALACEKTMAGSPKAVAECTSHTTMPACNPVTIALLK